MPKTGVVFPCKEKCDAINGALSGDAPSGFTAGPDDDDDDDYDLPPDAKNPPTVPDIPGPRGIVDGKIVLRSAAHDEAPAPARDAPPAVRLSGTTAQSSTKDPSPKQPAPAQARLSGTTAKPKLRKSKLVRCELPPHLS